MNFQLYFSKFENCKIDIIFSKILFKISYHSTILQQKFVLISTNLAFLKKYKKTKKKFYKNQQNTLI